MAPIDASEQELSTASITDNILDTASMKSRRLENVLVLAIMRDMGFGQTFSAPRGLPTLLLASSLVGHLGFAKTNAGPL
ncbi:MAG: hypothetical protein VCE75_03105 [Alphaproteobacteria bacterium]